MMKTTLSRKAQNSQAERKRYRTELPNIIDDLGLDVYEFRLYAHVKRVAGENGFCNQNNETMAKACGFSHPKVIAAKKALALPRPELGGKALITRQGKSGKTIRIVDVWSENLKTYKKSSAQDSKSDLASDNEPDLLDTKSHLPNSKSGLHKEGTYKNEQNKEREDTLSSVQNGDEILETDVINDGVTKASSRSLPKSAARKVAPSRLPDGWRPSKDGLYWAWNLLNKKINVTAATEKFIAHCKAKGITSYDWDASWRKWIRDERALTPNEISNQSEEEHYEIIGDSSGASVDVQEDVVECIASFGRTAVPFTEIREALPDYSEEVLRHVLRGIVEHGDELVEPEQDSFQVTPNALNTYGYEEAPI